MHVSQWFKGVLGCVVTGFVSSSAFGAVTPPYANDFALEADAFNFAVDPDGSGDPADFGNWALDDGKLVATVFEGSNNAASAMLQVDGPIPMFRVSSSFVITQAAFSSSSTASVIAAGNSDLAIGDDQMFYDLSMTRTGRLRLYEFGGSGTLFQQTVPLGVDGEGEAVTSLQGQPMELILEGVYTATGLELTATVNYRTYDGGPIETYTTSYLDDSDPYMGTWFGLRWKNGGTTGDGSAEFDAFAVSVPEPANLAVIGFGVAGLLVHRRR